MIRESLSALQPAVSQQLGNSVNPLTRAVATFSGLAGGLEDLKPDLKPNPTEPPRVKHTSSHQTLRPSVILVLMTRHVDHDGARKNEDVVLPGGDVHAVAVSPGEPLLRNAGDDPAATGEFVLLVEQVVPSYPGATFARLAAIGST